MQLQVDLCSRDGHFTSRRVPTTMNMRLIEPEHLLRSPAGRCGTTRRTRLSLVPPRLPFPPSPSSRLITFLYHLCFLDPTTAMHIGQLDSTWVHLSGIDAFTWLRRDAVLPNRCSRWKYVPFPYTPYFAAYLTSSISYTRQVFWSERSSSAQKCFLERNYGGLLAALSAR